MNDIEFKDYQKEKSIIQSRIVELIIFLLLLMFVVIARAAYLQIYSYKRFDVLSKDNRVRLLPLPPVRGQIFDRNGKVLAENKPVFTLEILPSEVDDLRLLLEQMSQIIAVSPQEIKRFRSKVKVNPKFEPQVLKVNLDEAEIARFSVNQHKFKGASVNARLQRFYPYAGELAHVLGYVGRINKKEVDRLDKQAYKGTRYIGKLGLEEKYESELLGTVGYEQVEHNAHGRKIRVLDKQPAVSGKDLVLNLDIDLQIKARELLGDFRGSIVAIEPETGAILAFVSNPVYDPNKFVNGIDHFSYNALRDDVYRPLLNRTLNGRYAPGSTIKGLVALAGLENDWPIDKKVACPGYFQLKGSSHRYRCWKREGHGLLSLKDSIMRSCDIYYYQIASYLGIDKMHGFLSKFGLGQKTGVDLKGEPSGLMPSRQWKKRVRKNPWYPGETVITGIGQGYTLVTPLQLGTLTATLANKGMRIEPRLVNYIRDASQPGNTVKHYQYGKLLSALNIKPESLEVVLQSMRAVVHEAGGTARSLSRNIEYEMAGKSGTAQVVAIAQGAKYDESILSEFQKDHALFVAFAPYEKPKISVAVIVENGGSGSSVAGPIAKGVIDAYLLKQTDLDDLQESVMNAPDSATVEQ